MLPIRPLSRRMFLTTTAAGAVIAPSALIPKTKEEVIADNANRLSVDVRELTQAVNDLRSGRKELVILPTKIRFHYDDGDVINYQTHIGRQETFWKARKELGAVIFDKYIGDEYPYFDNKIYDAPLPKLRTSVASKLRLYYPDTVPRNAGRINETLVRHDDLLRFRKNHEAVAIRLRGPGDIAFHQMALVTRDVPVSEKLIWNVDYPHYQRG